MSGIRTKPAQLRPLVSDENGAARSEPWTRDQNPHPLAKNARRMGHPLRSDGLMSAVYTWSAILAVVFASVVGDVLLARAMKQVGDVGALRRRQGLWTVIVRGLGH